MAQKFEVSVAALEGALKKLKKMEMDSISVQASGNSLILVAQDNHVFSKVAVPLFNATSQLVQFTVSSKDLYRFAAYNPSGGLTFLVDENYCLCSTMRSSYRFPISKNNIISFPDVTQYRRVLAIPKKTLVDAIITCLPSMCADFKTADLCGIRAHNGFFQASTGRNFSSFKYETTDDLHLDPFMVGFLSSTLKLSGVEVVIFAQLGLKIMVEVGDDRYIYEINGVGSLISKEELFNKLIDLHEIFESDICLFLDPVNQLVPFGSEQLLNLSADMDDKRLVIKVVDKTGSEMVIRLPIHFRSPMPPMWFNIDVFRSILGTLSMKPFLLKTAKIRDLDVCVIEQNDVQHFLLAESGMIQNTDEVK